MRQNVALPKKIVYNSFHVYCLKILIFNIEDFNGCLINNNIIMRLFMSENNEEQENEKENIPAMQRILDNPFLLLFIGVVVPTVFYTMWGIMEIVTIPVAP